MRPSAARLAARISAGNPLRLRSPPRALARFPPESQQQVAPPPHCHLFALLATAAAAAAVAPLLARRGTCACAGKGAPLPLLLPRGVPFSSLVQLSPRHLQGPIVVATHNYHLDDVLAQVPPVRHSDLVLVQNGLLDGRWWRREQQKEQRKSQIPPCHSGASDIGGTSGKRGCYVVSLLPQLPPPFFPNSLPPIFPNSLPPSFPTPSSLLSQLPPPFFPNSLPPSFPRKCR
ncbi:unnamed protein product [Closterium sp. Naga37s-1]|nr:unnamed protein product [Closterium sp. Naga37s-1]